MSRKLEPVLALPGVAVVVVPVEAPERAATAALAVEHILVQHPLARVGVQESERKTDHDDTTSRGRS